MGRHIYKQINSVPPLHPSKARLCFNVTAGFCEAAVSEQAVHITYHCTQVLIRVCYDGRWCNQKYFPIFPVDVDVTSNHDEIVLNLYLHILV